MRYVEQFDPIEVGEVDTFVFDLFRAGTRQVVAAQWRVFLTPFSLGSDPNPLSRIKQIWIGDTITFNGFQEQGQYTFARIGPMPASAAGATYVFAYKVFLDDGDQIQGSATCQCNLPGQ